MHIAPEFKNKLDGICRMRTNYYNVYFVYATRAKIMNRSTIPLGLMFTDLDDGRRYTLCIYIELRTHHVFSASNVSAAPVERKKYHANRNGNNAKEPHEPDALV
jgi:hypothetical protein